MLLKDKKAKLKSDLEIHKETINKLVRSIKKNDKDNIDEQLNELIKCAILYGATEQTLLTIEAVSKRYNINE